jgi:KipI family sensor histidine kinase inhibitor
MTTPYDEPVFLPAGDAALLVEVGDAIDPAINSRVHALDRALRQRPILGLLDLVPAYRSLLVLYDPLAVSAQAVEAHISTLWDETATVGPAVGRVVRIPTCYGARFGPDLAFVAKHARLPAEEVVAIHAGTDYRVYMMGFSPGFTYLGGMSERIAAPRLKTPRTSIPAGSVGIAQQQTGIYPVESPGGWQLIGRTPVPLFDPLRDPPTAVEPGDSIRFVPIDAAEFERICRTVEAGQYEIDARMAPR